MLYIKIVQIILKGGDVGAREGKLSIMCGGSKDTFDKVFKIF